MPRRSKPSDRALWNTLNTSRDKFLGFLRGRISDPQVVEDLLQQSLLQALKAEGDLKNKENVVSWFYRILQNALIDYYRHRASDRRKAEALERELRDVKEFLPQETKKAVCQCMHGLLPAMNPDYAQLVDRLDLKDEEPGKVARDLGITKNNLTVRLHRARKALKKSLQSACGSCAEHGCLDCSCKHP
jgi:RNA polymerase sigma factor (sigma-70 family)